MSTHSFGAHVKLSMRWLNREIELIDWDEFDIKINSKDPMSVEAKNF